MAHAKMLGRQGIIPKGDSEKIIRGLKGIKKDIEAGRFRFRADLEDIHMNIEAALTRRIGPAGGRLHTARSRNDQIALDMRLYARAEAAEVVSLIKGLIGALVDAAEKNIEVPMPGYTHLQRAQPVLLSHHLLAYAEMLLRDIGRFKDAVKRADVLPLGSCALSGTSLPIDRAYVARLLKFGVVSSNSMDSVSDRDFVAEFISAGAVLMMHLSRLAEEFVIWATEEFSFIGLPDAFSTGSSIMPQKKNPDVAELIRGKTGRIYGNLMSILTVMKGLPLAYNRDMQEDKPALFDTVDTLKASLRVFSEMLPNIVFMKKKMTESAGEGYSTATEMADYLVRKGLPFRDAHEAAGKAVLYSIKKKKRLSGLSLEEMKGFSGLFEKDVYPSLEAISSIEGKTSWGGTSESEVKKNIRRLRAALKK